MNRTNENALSTGKPDRTDGLVLKPFSILKRKDSKKVNQLSPQSPIASGKSLESMDSGVYLREKSCDSLESLNSIGSGINGNRKPFALERVSSDEVIPPLPILQYEDYIRECQDIQQSIIVRNKELGKGNISRSDSFDEQQDNDGAAEWLHMAGLSDLLVDPAFTQPGKLFPRDSLSSMTVLLTLTRPQREAVLRRISSFNRKQLNKPSKPSLNSVFPSLQLTSSATADLSPNEEKFNGSTRDLTTSRSLENLADDVSDNLSCTTMRPSSIRRSADFDEGSSESLKVGEWNESNDHDDEGIETLSISSRSDTSSWKSSKEELSITTEDSGCVDKPKCMSFSAEAACQEDLPDYSLVRDRLGITKISDMSPYDMRKVQSLALIELTALFDIRGIELKRRKAPKFKSKEPGVFGTPLTTLVDWDRKRSKSDGFVPLVFVEIIAFLEKRSMKIEGILRKSGSATRIKSLKQDIDLRFGLSSLSELSPASSSKAWSDAHPNDVAALLKQFLRELPDPLLTTEYINAFQSCRLLLDQKEQLQALNLLILLLNEVHRDSLKLLLQFLSRIVANEDHNKMSLNNVAMIVAPNLFINTRKSKKEPIVTQDLKVAAGTSNIVRMLIKYHKLLWTVPAFMLTQVRHMNNAEIGSKKHSNVGKDKLKVKFFQGGKKQSGKSLSFLQQITQPFDYETPKNLIRVQAPNMNLTSIAVQLTNQLTAGDVIAKYRRQCERMQQIGNEQREQISNINYSLCEVGGNICERSLDPITSISAVLRINPDASWFIRRRKER